MSDRFVRKVSRITLEWTVEVQSLFDRERRRLEQLARRLRRSDPAAAERLRSALADAVVDDADWPQRAARLLAVLDAAGDPAIRDPTRTEQALRAVERGVGRVEALEPPAELASWHAAVVAAEREYLVATRQFHEASTGADAPALVHAAERVERARAAINASLQAAPP